MSHPAPHSLSCRLRSATNGRVANTQIAKTATCPRRFRPAGPASVRHPRRRRWPPPRRQRLTGTRAGPGQPLRSFATNLRQGRSRATTRRRNCARSEYVLSASCGDMCTHPRCLATAGSWPVPPTFDKPSARAGVRDLCSSKCVAAQNQTSAPVKGTSTPAARAAYTISAGLPLSQHNSVSRRRQ